MTGELSDDEKLDAIRQLDDAFRHIVWARGQQKADPFWDEDDVVPDFVKNVIDDIALDALWDRFKEIPGALAVDVGEVIRDSLTQPQGWSLESITNNLQEEFGVSHDRAEIVARTETSAVLNEAREEGYKRSGELDDRLFKWVGPSDHRTTDVCKWLKERTKDGVPYDELIRLQKRALKEFDDQFGHLDWRKHCLHPHERHTYVETFKMSDAEFEWLIGKMNGVAPVTGTFASA